MGGKRGGKKPGDEVRALLRALGTVLPIPLTLFGVVVAVTTGFSLPPDVGALQSDTRLRQEGTTVPAVVTSVDVAHHSGRRSSYDVYTPTVSYSWHGDRTSVELGRYGVTDDAAAYRQGQAVTVMVGPSDSGSAGADVGIRSELARGALVGAVRNDVVLAAIGLLALVVAVATPVARRLRRRRGGRRGRG